VRAALEAWTSEPGGMLAAYRELQASDPIAASRIDEHNQRRVVRALEVIRTTGRPFSSFGPGLDRYGETVFPVALAGVWVPRDVLAARIAERFALMRDRGLVDEVRRLWSRPLSRTAAQAIGYKEIAGALENGGREDEIATALALAERRTRSFARRQRMWFRRDPRITWFAASRNPEAVLDAVLATWTDPNAVMSTRATVRGNR
jgi:tRNA dimethylallyltransferase